MTSWQFFSLQSSIMIVASLAAHGTPTKALFLLLTIAYMVMMVLSYRAEQCTPKPKSLMD